MRASYACIPAEELRVDDQLAGIDDHPLLGVAFSCASRLVVLVAAA
jgi:hypothetical protein